MGGAPSEPASGRRLGAGRSGGPAASGLCDNHHPLERALPRWSPPLSRPRPAHALSPVRRRRFGGRRPQPFSRVQLHAQLGLDRMLGACRPSPSSSASTSTPRPPGARRVAGCARAAVRGRPHVARRVGARSGRLRVHRLARPRPHGRRHRRSRRWRPSASCSRARSRATCPCSASATAARCSRRCSARRSGRRRCRSSAGARSRPTTPSSCPRGRGSSGTTSASARRPAPPSSRARPTPRRRSASARTSACSSTRRRPSRSSRAGRARTASRPTSPRRPGARGRAGRGLPPVRRLPRRSRERRARRRRPSALRRFSPAADQFAQNLRIGNMVRSAPSGACTTTASSRSSPRRTSSAAPRSSGTRTRPSSGRTPASTW